MKTVERKVSPVSDYYVYTPSKIAEQVFFYPVQCGLFTYEPGYVLFRNAFDSFLLMFVRHGVMDLDLPGKKQRVRENQFVLLDCYAPHGYSTTEGYECLWLHFDGSMARAYYQMIVSRLGNVFSLSDVFPVIRKMDAILRIFRENQTVHEALLSKYITDILTEFLIDSPGNRCVRSNAEAAEKAITYINEHFSEEISVEKLASLCGISHYHFIRVFKQETGYTPHEYILNRRMASARYLLRNSDLPVKEICYDTGFSSESVFCNAFKKHNGMTPKEYRLRISAPAVLPQS